jgi:hypothetical protein
MGLLFVSWTREGRERWREVLRNRSGARRSVATRSRCRFKLWEQVIERQEDEEHRLLDGCEWVEESRGRPAGECVAWSLERRNDRVLVSSDVKKRSRICWVYVVDVKKMDGG